MVTSKVLYILIVTYAELLVVSMYVYSITFEDKQKHLPILFGASGPIPLRRSQR